MRRRPATTTTSHVDPAQVRLANALAWDAILALSRRVRWKTWSAPLVVFQDRLYGISGNPWDCWRGFVGLYRFDGDGRRFDLVIRDGVVQTPRTRTPIGTVADVEPSAGQGILDRRWTTSPDPATN